MPQHKDGRRVRRKKLFASIPISPSTFIKDKLESSSSILGSGKPLHSKSTYFYRWGSYVVPGLCASALLFGGFIAITPQTSQVYADDGTNNNSGIELYTADSSISLTFSPEASFTGNANVNEVSYITNTFTVNVTDHASYTVKLNAMNGSGTELRGRDNAFATIKGVGNNKTPAEFTDNTWGYGYSDNTSANPATLTYSSMPAYGSDESMFTKTLTGTEKNEDYSYLLAFAAKIGADSPADHYVGNFLLSVVGTAFTPETFTINYNVNGGTGTIGAQSCTQTQVGGSCKLDITKDEPTRENYTFLGWADTQNATKVQYTPGSSISLDSTNTTLTGDKRVKTVYAVWAEDTVYSVTFEANAGTDNSKVTNMPSGKDNPLKHSEPSNSTVTSYQFTIPSTKPARDGFEFLGWAESNIATANDTIYQPGGSYTVQKSAPTKTLFAVWKANGPFGGITRMDQMNSTICSNAEIGDTAQLIDDRDGTTRKYWVTKLKGDTAETKANGKCWMTQNLDYNIPTSDIPDIKKITSVAEWTTGSSSTVTNTTAAYYDPGDYYYDGPSGNHSQGTTCTNTTGLSACTQFSTSGDAHYHVGNYYSYEAATKGTGSSVTSNGANASGSICPTGWRLPTSGSNTGEFRDLMLAYGWTTDNPSNIAIDMNSGKGIYGDPLYFVYGGRLYDGQLYYAGNYGFYWSSTSYSSTNAYSLNFYSGVNPSNDYYRYSGRSVRCVAE